MVSFGFSSRSSLVFIRLRQNHKDYIEQWETEFLPHKSDWGRENWICQQNEASIDPPKKLKKKKMVWWQWCSSFALASQKSRPHYCRKFLGCLSWTFLRTREAIRKYQGVPRIF